VNPPVKPEDRHAMTSTLFRATLLAAAAALALACGSSDHSSSTVDGGGPTGPGDGSDTGGGDLLPPPRACGGQVTVRLRGTNAGPVTAFHLAVGGASFTVDGGPAIPGVGAQTLDLLSDQAWRLGTVPYAEGAHTIVATVTLAGGDGATDAGPVSFGACLAPLVVPIDLSNVDPVRCHAVIHLDLAGSVVTAAGAGASGKAFVPNFALFF
jgi:hypothetical protein